MNDSKKEKSESKTAIGVLFNNLATCNGYTDTAALLLDRIKVPNIKISNDDHIWNLVYINNKWLHLDVTWDDPINTANLNKDILQHDYFLKTTNEFYQTDILNSQDEHNFNKEIYYFVN